MNYAQPAYGYQQPYAPPTGVAAFDPTGHKPQIRIWFLITALLAGSLYVAGMGLFVGAAVINDRSLSPTLMMVGFAVLMLGALLIYVKLGLALYWLHGAWKWMPVEQRVTREGKRISPGDVFMLLIPYYHFYWMFPINLALCDAMERLRAPLAAQPRTDPPPRDTAMWGAICELIPFANFFVAPFLWASYMRRVDLMHDEILNAVASHTG